jgi:hypothetical protein
MELFFEKNVKVRKRVMYREMNPVGNRINLPGIRPEIVPIFGPNNFKNHGS